MKKREARHLRLRGAALAGALLIAAVAGRGQRAFCASAGSVPASGYFDYEQTMRLPAGRPLTTEHKLWFKGQSYRRESISMGTRIVTLGGPNGTFVILPGRSDAMKLAGPGRQAVAGVPGLPVLDSAAIQRFAKRVGTAKVGRYQTEVYESRNVFQTPAGKGQKGTVKQELTTRYWISRDLPGPVKVSMEGAGPKSSPVVTILKSARMNVAVPENLLRLPKGMKVSTPAPPRALSSPPTRAGGKK